MGRLASGRIADPRPPNSGIYMGRFCVDRHSIRPPLRWEETAMLMLPAFRTERRNGKLRCLRENRRDKPVSWKAAVRIKALSRT